MNKNCKTPLTAVLVALLIGVSVAPSGAGAQGSDASGVVLTMQPILTNLPSVGTAPAIGASFAPAGVTSKMAIAPVSIPAARLSTGESVGKNRAMMGVGIAALLIGLIVGGDAGTLIAIGGALFALVGLYRYMR